LISRLEFLMQPTTFDPLEMLKVLADEKRLALLRHLAAGEHSVSALAGLVQLSEPTVSHHLSRLRAAGLVNLRMEGAQHFYRANPAGLDQFKQAAAIIEQFPAAPPGPSDDSWIAALNWPAADQQVLREYTRNGVLTRLPTKQKRLLVILRWLASRFEPGTLYTEAQVNGILKAAYPDDYVSLRRDLVDFGYLRRDRAGGKYLLQHPIA
jgi:hypothetical protein